MGILDRYKFNVALRQLEKALNQRQAITESQRTALRKHILDTVPKSLHIELFDREVTQRAIGKRSCEWDENLTESPSTTMTVRPLEVHFKAAGEQGAHHGLIASLPFRFARTHNQRHIVWTINGLLVRERPDGSFVAGFLANSRELTEPQYAIRPRLAYRIAERYGEKEKPIYHLDGKTPIFTPKPPQ